MNEGRDQRNGTDRIRRWAAASVIASRQDLGKMPGLCGLRGCRHRAGLSQSKVAERVGISKVNYVHWENCHQWPYSYYLPRLAVALGASIEELFLGPEDTEEDTT